MPNLLYMMMLNLSSASKKYICYRFILLLFFTATGALLIGCGNSQSEDILSETSIFSWDASYITEENEALLSDTMNALSCTSIYQQIPKATPTGLVLDFLLRRNRQGQQPIRAPEPSFHIDTASGSP